MKAVVLLWLAACGPGLAPRDPHDVARDALVASADNADDLEWLFHDSVVDGGIWFPDGACASQFANPGAIAKAKLHAFASCLANLHLRASTRDDALGDVVVLDYGPGIELEARIVQELDAPHLTWIGYASRRPGEPMVPTITADALDRVRTAGDRNGPLDPAVAATLKLDPTPTSHAQFTWVRLCVDQNGAVTTLHAGGHSIIGSFRLCIDDTGAVISVLPKKSTGYANYDRELMAGMAQWRYSPFEIDGTPAPVCTGVVFVYGMK